MYAADPPIRTPDHAGARGPWPRLYAPEEVVRVEAAARVARHALAAAIRATLPGATTREVGEVARAAILARGARPAFEGYHPPGTREAFPAAACVCINDEALHAPPSERRIRVGDLVTIDVGAERGGWFADLADTVVVGDPGSAPEAWAVRTACRAALARAVRIARPGVRWSEVARAIRAEAARRDLAPLPNAAGHGIGRRLHEPPAANPATRPGSPDDFVLLPGMVLTIEPLLARPGVATSTGRDGWTRRTTDGSLTAHAERMVHIARAGARFLGLPRTSENADAPPRGAAQARGEDSHPHAGL